MILIEFDIKASTRALGVGAIHGVQACCSSTNNYAGCENAANFHVLEGASNSAHRLNLGASSGTDSTDDRAL